MSLPFIQQLEQSLPKNRSVDARTSYLRKRYSRFVHCAFPFNNALMALIALSAPLRDIARITAWLPLPHECPAPSLHPRHRPGRPCGNFRCGEAGFPALRRRPHGPCYRTTAAFERGPIFRTGKLMFSSVDIQDLYAVMLACCDTEVLSNLESALAKCRVDVALWPMHG